MYVGFNHPEKLVKIGEFLGSVWIGSVVRGSLVRRFSLGSSVVRGSVVRGSLVRGSLVRGSVVRSPYWTHSKENIKMILSTGPEILTTAVEQTF